MAVRAIRWTVTASGSDGSAAGTAQAPYPVSGRVLTVGVVPDEGTATAVVSTLDPAQMLVSVTGLTAAAVYRPRVQSVTYGGTANAGDFVPYSVVGVVQAVVSAANDGDEVAFVVHFEE